MSASPRPVLPDFPASHWQASSAGTMGAPRPAPAALRVFVVGAASVGLAVLPFKYFELDRFFVPKEVALQLVAAAALVATARPRTVTRGATTPPVTRLAAATGVDLALACFLAVSLASAALAPSGWLAARALGVSAAGVALFWAARDAARAGWSTAVLWAAALLPIVAVATALAQAYGLQSEYFSLNRAPGGTFGNRNFVAHLCAIGLPVLAYLALRARRAPEVAGATVAFAAAAAALVLTRSRGAWLAASVAALPFAAGLLRAAAARRDERRRDGQPPHPRTRPLGASRVRAARAPILVAAAAVAAVAAVRLPNALDWRSDSPYLDSARDVVNYREGSGQGRLTQWRHSARLVVQAPLLGVGPGNWPVRYPAVAPARDPSLTKEGTTDNPWPSSDWVAFVSERGLLGAGAAAAAFFFLALRAHHLVWRTAAADARLRGGALGAVLAAALTAGAFDAVLLLAAPAFLTWTTAGALAGADDAPARGRPRGASWLLVGALLAAAVVSAAHAAAMDLFSDGRARALDQAARIAPGDYRIQLRAAQVALHGGRCDVARPRAVAAQRVAPSAPAPARVLRACGANAPRGRR